MYSSEIPTKPSGTLTHPLPLANSASDPIGPSCRLLSPADYPILLTSLFCLLLLTLGPSFPRPLWSRWKSRAQALCVCFVPKQTKESSDWHLPTPEEMNANHRVTYIRVSLSVNEFELVSTGELLLFLHS